MLSTNNPEGAFGICRFVNKLHGCNDNKNKGGGKHRICFCGRALPCQAESAVDIRRFAQPRTLEWELSQLIVSKMCMHVCVCTHKEVRSLSQALVNFFKMV